MLEVISIRTSKVFFWLSEALLHRQNKGEKKEHQVYFPLNMGVIRQYHVFQ